MQQEKQASIDFPKENERIDPKHYSSRITAPEGTTAVEASIDDGAWKPCRYDAGHWWLDLHNVEQGRHEVAVRIQSPDRQHPIVRTRRFHAAAANEAIDVIQGGRDMRKQRVQQYNVLCPNRPGAIAKLTQLLAQEDANIKGLATFNMGTTTQVQFVADREENLRETLERAGFKAVAHQAVQIEVPNRPGELHRALRALAEREIDILSIYGTADGGRTAKFILNVAQPEEASQALARFAADEERDDLYAAR